MDLSALLLSRLQFAFTVSFHIIFPSFTIGLAAWLTVLEALHLATGRPAYRSVFEFWLKIFGVAFGLGVVSGIVMAFEFGTNWSELSRVSGPIQGPLLTYETFTAFVLEASFFGVLLFGRQSVAPWFYLFSTAMVALGTTFSAFWIMVNNSWMQAPVGYAVENGVFVADDWSKIIFSPVVWVRFPHMLLASYLTGAFCVAATGAWYLLRRRLPAEARIMLRMGLYLAAVLIPAQLFFGHLTGDYVHDYQPAKFAAIEARWHDEQPASEVLIAIPDPASETNRYAISVPVLGSLIASMSFTSKEVGLTDFPPEDRPPVLIPFFAFRIMVGCGLVMLLLAWLGTYLERQGPHRAKSPAALVRVSQLPPAVHRDLDRLVHRRGGPPALDRLRRAAHRGRPDAVPDDARGGDLACRLLLRLPLHLRLRRPLHLSPASRRPCRQSRSAAEGRRPQPSDVRARSSGPAGLAPTSRQENSR